MSGGSTAPGALVELDVADGIAVLTLADPARRNVLSAGMVDGIVAAVDRAEAEANVLVVTGAPPAFCAGAELSGLADAISGDFAGIEHVYRGFLRVAECSLTTIAAVDGPAVGAGLNLALACDVRIAGEAARFESRFGAMHLHPGGGHVWMLQRLIGSQAATAMVALGAPVDARRALELGLVWAVHPSAELPDRARELAAGLGAKDPAFARQLAATLRAAPTITDHRTAVDHERYAQRWSVAQPAFADGIRGAVERLRRPEGRGDA